ncbi:hypothetical protein DF3PB_10053 [uncultured Defluviicoccus sp.]|uniref:Uncharacterized protein n=1 Tax=metagenome TaxID=256318 RepID=A0A380T8I4_9ZZZZ|nr:hypothetical protein DF3PB_10053 [uncultured Defluviicoccus sp.]
MTNRGSVVETQAASAQLSGLRPIFSNLTPLSGHRPPNCPEAVHGAGTAVQQPWGRRLYVSASPETRSLY